MPVTAPAGPAATASAAALAWNEPPDAPELAPQPALEADRHVRPRLDRAARSRQLALAFGTVLVLALITAVALISSEDQSGGGRTRRAHGASIHSDNAVLPLPAASASRAGQALAVEIEKLGSRVKQAGTPAGVKHPAARQRRHAAHSVSRAAASSGRQTVTPTPAADQSSATTASGQATNSTGDSSSAAGSPSTAGTAGGGSRTDGSGSSGAASGGSGSGESTTTKQGPPPCYPGTLGCQ